MKIGFVTGARSEYGVMKNLIRSIASDSNFETRIYVTGMHFLVKYGYTIDEIKKDNYAPIVELPCYKEENQSKEQDFISLIDTLNKGFSTNKPDVIYIIGDRLEAYAAALAAHFNDIPVAHFAGGQITKGAVDNIYRYNISNIASLHFVTNVFAEERLRQIPIIDNTRIYHVGSSAIDNILNYLSSPKSMIDVDPRLTRNGYVLMTFHPQTIGSNEIPLVMDNAISTIVKHSNVLITYPNNDDGAEEIIEVIKKWEDNEHVIVIPNLGSQYYYTAIDNSLFVIGNSSSGIIEVPYFSKFTFNIGRRQEGRNAPRSVINISDNSIDVDNMIKDFFSDKLVIPKQEYMYGKGNSIEKIKKALLEVLG